jgi:hypothetical protein
MGRFRRRYTDPRAYLIKRHVLRRRLQRLSPPDAREALTSNEHDVSYVLYLRLTPCLSTRTRPTGTISSTSRRSIAMSPTASNNLETAPLPPAAFPPNTKPEPNTTETTNDEEETTYPEGGLRAWLVVLGSFCGMYDPPYTPNLPPSPATNPKPKASLLRLHEQHQHLQHLPLHAPTSTPQHKLNRLDLQHLHLPDLPVRNLHRSRLRCERSAGSGFCWERIDDG